MYEGNSVKEGRDYRGEGREWIWRKWRQFHAVEKKPLISHILYSLIKGEKGGAHVKYNNNKGFFLEGGLLKCQSK